MEPGSPEATKPEMDPTLQQFTAFAEGLMDVGLNGGDVGLALGGYMQTFLENNHTALSPQDIERLSEKRLALVRRTHGQ